MITPSEVLTAIAVLFLILTLSWFIAIALDKNGKWSGQDDSYKIKSITSAQKRGRSRQIGSGHMYRSQDPDQDIRWARNSPSYRGSIIPYEDNDV